MVAPEKIYIGRSAFTFKSKATQEEVLKTYRKKQDSDIEYIRVDLIESQKLVHPLVRKLVRLQQKYIKMLGDEIDSIAPIAHAHGWKSKNIEIGEKLREQIKKVKKGLT